VGLPARAALWVLTNEELMKIMGEEGKERQIAGLKKGTKRPVAPILGQRKNDRSGRSDHKAAKEAEVAHSTLFKARKIAGTSRRSIEQVKLIAVSLIRLAIPAVFRRPLGG
jgi:hypothetical protein